MAKYIAILVLVSLLGTAVFPKPQKILMLYGLGNPNHGTDIKDPKKAPFHFKKMLEELKDEHGIANIVYSNNPDIVSNLSQFDVVLFTNTGAQSFKTKAQKDQIKNWMEKGGKAIGFHAANDQWYYWDWWSATLHGGLDFKSHDNASFTLDADPELNTLSAFASMWRSEDLGDIAPISKTEIYIFETKKGDIRGKPGVTLLQIVSPSSYSSGKYDVLDYRPFTWTVEVGKGRYIYTALGHGKGDFQSGWLKKGVWGMMRYLAGDYDEPVPTEGCKDEDANNYDGNAMQACAANACCIYDPCCKTPGYVETDMGCKNHTSTQCRTVGVGGKTVKPGKIQLSSHGFSVDLAGLYAVNMQNVNGESVISESTQGSREYSFKHLPAGLYVIKITYPGGIIIRRILLG